MSKRSILFISHDASRTGAPILLLNFLQWFKTQSDIPFHIIFVKTGELEGEFRKIASVTIYNRRRFIKKIFNRLGFSNIFNYIQHQYLKNIFSRANIGLVYANTISAGEILQLLPFLPCPVITHVHELSYAVEQLGGEENMTLVKDRTTHFIAASDAVKINLVDNYGIPVNDIDVIHEFITLDVSQPKCDTKLKYSICKIMNIPQNAFIVGACGNLEWRKAPDLFIQVANEIIKKQLRNPIHFIWVGGLKQGAYFDELCQNIKNMGLSNLVHFTGILNNPLDYFSIFDVFALVSREDPFPLVMLEAASLGKPIVYFENTGGANEFVEEDCGIAVPHLDVKAMSASILTLLNSSDLRQRLGQNCQTKIQKYYAAEIIAPKILALIKQYISIEKFQHVRT